MPELIRGIASVTLPQLAHPQLKHKKLLKHKSAPCDFHIVSVFGEMHIMKCVTQRTELVFLSDALGDNIVVRRIHRQGICHNPLNRLAGKPCRLRVYGSEFAYGRKRLNRGRAHLIASVGHGYFSAEKVFLPLLQGFCYIGIIEKGQVNYIVTVRGNSFIQGHSLSYTVLNGAVVNDCSDYAGFPQGGVCD